MAVLAAIQLLLLLSSLLGTSSPSPLTRAVDLTHVVGPEDTLVWPGTKEFEFDIVFRNEVHGVYLEMNNFCQAEHSGTHMDAPAHFGRGKWHSADIPLERLVGPAVVIDISKRAETDFDTMLEVADLKAWEKEYGTIPDGAVVIMNSGWSKKYHNFRDFFGYPEGITIDKNNTQDLHFPGIHPKAAEWLVKNRNIVGVAVDTPSLDHGQSRDFKSHQIILPASIWGIEMLANVDKLPRKGYDLYAPVYKLKEGSGGPVRVYALPSAASEIAARSLASTVAFAAAAVFMSTKMTHFA